MTRPKRSAVGDALTEAQRLELLGVNLPGIRLVSRDRPGPGDMDGSHFASREERRAAWLEHRRELLPLWEAENPDRRHPLEDDR